MKCGYYNTEKNNTEGDEIMEWKCYCKSTVCQEIEKRSLNLYKTMNIMPDKLSSLKFHIKSQDYFGTLATVLSLCRQGNQPIPEHIIDELIYLQNNFKIVAPDNDGKNRQYDKAKQGNENRR